MALAEIVFNQIIVMLVFVLLGAIFQKRAPMNEHEIGILSKIVLMVLGPGVLLSCAAQDFTHVTMRNCLIAGGLGVGVYVLLLVVGYLLGMLLTKDAERRLIYSMLCSFGNVGFFGVPLIAATYSADVAVYLYFFVVPCNLCSYTLGIALSSTFGGHKMRMDWKRLLNPGFLSCVFVILAFFTGVHLPAVPAKICSYLATASTPMAMFLVGVSLCKLDWKQAMTDWRMLLFCVIRQLAIPVLFGLLLKGVISDAALRGIATIMIALPIGNATILLADYMESESLPAPGAVAVSTIASIVTVPAIVAILL
ncbi:MAG: AEC family transporter [Oscillospiraceae bacterium]|nr:AEC family transporter [Oscillospiraceae bacterium]